MAEFADRLLVQRVQHIRPVERQQGYAGLDAKRYAAILKCHSATRSDSTVCLYRVRSERRSSSHMVVLCRTEEL
jgi:hypothetical protein